MQCLKGTSIACILMYRDQISQRERLYKLIHTSLWITLHLSHPCLLDS